MRFPLYSKILLWFLLNLVAVGGAFIVLFHLQFRSGLATLLLGQAGERLQAVSDLITAELNEQSSSAWTNVLQRFSRAYHVQFVLFGREGQFVAGDTLELPPQVLTQMAAHKPAASPSARSFRQGRGPPPGRGPPAGRGPGWRWETSTNQTSAGSSRGLLTEPRGAVSWTKFLLPTSHPTRYWIGLPLVLNRPERSQSGPYLLLTMASTWRGSGLFVEVRPWLAVGVAVLLFSLLFWFPLVRGMTRSISQMTRATEQIAAGQFETQVRADRRDELGRLGQAINRMAGRLSGYVTGQKRFLGDIAHELCSPLARIQVALGILEQRADEKQRAYVTDVREEVQQMSGLINELLSFSKAGLQAKAIKLEPVHLAGLIREVLAHEGVAASAIALEVGESLNTLAEPALLSRAVANVLRNALRYGGAGPIAITANASGEHITLTIADTGPGVPAEALEHIFDPFFRLEPSRSRETGGVGLGLAIVKTCVAACHGTVCARNRPRGGLEIELRLTACRENAASPPATCTA